ncbi:unnamed protein product [Caenorhabditis auriculariae]|uniref:Ig-like domain-containing protein n=1 Tax=Caenorhabditis auriculariae TaxID=2777116 RepID=A0A8S1HU05_9PELO|nr:unnamed protein product [Caenorhabditis auriculariae]
MIELRPRCQLQQLTSHIRLFGTSMINQLFTLLSLGSLFYTAESLNSNEKDDELLFTEFPKESPHIVRHSYFKQEFKLGYKLKLFCKATGHPRPQIVWYHNGAEVNPDKGRTIRYTLHDSTLSSFLDVDPTTIADAGEYECVASNAKGNHVRSFKAHYIL